MDVVIDLSQIRPLIRARLMAHDSQVETPDLSDVMVSVETILLDELLIHTRGNKGIAFTLTGSIVILLPSA